MTAEAAPTSSSLPAGISKPPASINPQDQSGLIAILTAFSLGLILLSIATRLYVRHEFRLYRIDDYAFFAAIVFAIIQSSLVFKELELGLGKAEDRMLPADTATIQKLGFATDLFYLIILFISKCCVSFLFLCLTPGPAHMRVIWAIVAASTTWFTASVIIMGIRCNPKQPWTDNMSTCSNYFARWAVIGAVDAAIELALVVNAIYIVFDLQMALKSKIVVVGAFSWRLPNIAFTIVRLVYLSYPYETPNPQIWHSRVACATQLALGFTITATVIPYLKPFMMAYERPATHTSYPHSSSGTRFKLSNLNSRNSRNSEGASAAQRTGDVEDDGTAMENDPQVEVAKPRLERKKITMRLGRLRPERTRYEVSASATEAEGQERSEHGSEDSERMIIKKGVEWSVKYHNNDSIAGDQRNSVAGTEESRGPMAGPDEITTIRSHNHI